MKILEGADEYVWNWVNDRLKNIRSDNYRALGVMDDSTMLAGIIYHNYIKEYGNIEISIAADKPQWATRAIIKSLLRYPFTQLNCRRITLCIAASNSRALRCLDFGFKKEGIVRFGFGHEDAVICGLLKEEAKYWLEEKS